MFNKTNNYYITTPIYYVNSPPHIGHAYTTLAADVLARWQDLQGKQAFFLTGTDEHGAKIFQAAEEAGQEPQKFCDQIAGQFKKAWANLDIDYSHFIRTTDKDHQKGVVEFLNLLKDKGMLYEAKYTGLYCIGCEKFITEKDLVNGQCPDHKKRPERISEKNWFFKLKQFLAQIEKLIRSDELLIRPVNAKKEVLGLFKQGLDDFSISRQKVSWGIPLPWDKSQTIYVWIDALLNYWTVLNCYCEGAKRKRSDRGNLAGGALRWHSAQAPRRAAAKNGIVTSSVTTRRVTSSACGLLAVTDKGKFWPPDLHLIGRDILKFHAVYWPAMLLAAGLKLPRQIFIHGYFTVNGQKMSKTLGNVIDPNDLIKKFGVDATRYLLLSQFPFGKDGDISVDKLTETYNADLANGLGNLVARIARFGIKYKVLSIKYDQKHTKLLQELKLYEALQLAQKQIKECDGLVEKIRPWQIKDRTEQKKSLKPIIDRILVIAQMLKPFIPQTSEKIFKLFKTGKSEILFPRM